MTNQEKEALLKRIYSLPTEWADGGGSYGKGGPVGSEDAAMLWPEDVIDVISQFAEDNNAPVKQPDTMISLEWVKTTDRLPTKEDAGIDDLIAFCYRDEWDCFNRLEKWDEISPQKHTYWHRMLKAPEVEEC